VFRYYSLAKWPICSLHLRFELEDVAFEVTGAVQNVCAFFESLIWPIDAPRHSPRKNLATKSRCSHDADQMTASETISLFERYVMPTYARQPLVFVRGKGARVWDADGKEYLDFGGGIAVNVLGHAHPAVTTALTRQSSVLMHTSNLYYTGPQGLLAKRLVELVGTDGKPATAGKCFFCNSGGEANEALFKLARKHGGGRYEILTFAGSFHGRTLAGISATGQDKIKKGFEPMVDGFRHVPFNDLDAVAKAIGPKTAAILLEPIQGESGVQPATPEFLRGLRRLCDEQKLLLMFDEVQCGIGRTGEFCGFKSIAADVIPDAISWAKGLAGGFPIGAIWARAPFADLLGPGSHASTFGGTPLACAVALAVLDEVVKLMPNVRDVGRYFMEKLQELACSRSVSFGSTAAHAAATASVIKEVRGVGLMVGVEFSVEAKVLIPKLAERGLLGVAAGTHVVRFLPPLNITRADVDEAMEKLGRTLHDSGTN
jgi:acetylornithine/N-succinyldiaminopimelate aminotransferase